MFSGLSRRAWLINVIIVLIAAGVHQVDSRMIPGTYKALETFLQLTPIQLGALSLAQNLAGNVVRCDKLSCRIGGLDHFCQPPNFNT